MHFLSWLLGDHSLIVLLLLNWLPSFPRSSSPQTEDTQASVLGHLSMLIHLVSSSRFYFSSTYWKLPKQLFPAQNSSPPQPQIHTANLLILHMYTLLAISNLTCSKMNSWILCKPALPSYVPFYMRENPFVWAKTLQEHLTYFVSLYFFFTLSNTTSYLQGKSVSSSFKI